MKECEHLTGRLREICEGTADLPIHKINAYRTKWGMSQLSASRVEIVLVKQPPTKGKRPRKKTVSHGCSGCGSSRPIAAKPNGYGPGSQLLKIWDGMPHCDACLTLAAKMDRWGKDECFARIDEIVSDILPRAKAWLTDNKPWVHRVLLVTCAEDVVLKIAVKRDVAKAIAAAETRPATKTKRRRRKIQAAQDAQPVLLEAPERSLPIYDRSISQNTAKGIVTGASSIHWPCLGALAIGAVQQNLGLAVADHGLKEWQHAELDRIGVRWIAHDTPDLGAADVRKGIVSAVRAWWKPWVCLGSPFDCSLWIDSDAVIVGDVSALFDLAPCVSTQNKFMHEGARIYRKLTDYMFVAGERHLLLQFENINTGIIAWRKNEPIIDAWQRTCQEILLDQEKLKRCFVRDQTGLVVTLVRRAAAGDSLPVKLDDEYNWPADGLSARKSRDRSTAPLIPEDLLRHARLNNPQARIVHWLGRKKPWGTIHSANGIGWGKAE